MPRARRGARSPSAPWSRRSCSTRRPACCPGPAIRLRRRRGSAAAGLGHPLRVVARRGQPAPEAHFAPGKAGGTPSHPGAHRAARLLRRPRRHLARVRRPADGPVVRAGCRPFGPARCRGAPDRRLRRRDARRDVRAPAPGLGRRALARRRGQGPARRPRDRPRTRGGAPAPRQPAAPPAPRGRGRVAADGGRGGQRGRPPALPARLFLGRVADRRGRRAEAAASYRRALEAWPDSQAARLGLAQVVEASSGPAAARALVDATLAASRRHDRRRRSLVEVSVRPARALAHRPRASLGPGDRPMKPL